MTSPNADRPPERRRFWKIAAISLGAGTLIVGTAAAVGAWLFINRGLTPLLERRLSNLLERELELGELEGISWNGLRVGPSRLNATETDPTYVTAEAVEVGFNPLQVLFERELNIDLELIEAQGYLEQDPEEGWIGVDVPTFEPPPEEPLVKVRLDTIDITDSQITLVPLPADGTDPDPLLMTDLNGSVNIEPVEVRGQNSQRIEFDATTTPPQGGNLEIIGAVVPTASGNSARPIRQEIRLGIGGEGVAAETAMAFLLPTLGQKNLPIAATAGRVSGQWTVSFLPEQPVTVEGAGSIDNGQLELISLPSEGAWGNTIDDIDATIRFKGTTITVDSAKGSYADLETTATGTIDWTGDYDLIAQVDDVDLEQLLERAEVDVPIVLSGVFDNTVAITGPMLQPKLSADVAAAGPVTVDRVVLNDLDANVVMQSDRIENLLDTITVTDVRARPELGGQVTGSGVLSLAQLAQGGPPQLNFQLQATEVSGNAIAALYDVEQLPVTLGVVSATATLIGPPDALETRINGQAPNLIYGGQIYPTTATAIFADGGLTIPQALVQVGTGTLTGNGKVEADSWQANIAANNVNLQALGVAQVPPGNLNADVALAGPLQGASLENLLALGNYSLQLADGSVQGDVELRDGGWRTDATLNALGLGQFSPQLRGNTSGTVSLAGRIDALALDSLQGSGDLTFSAGLAGLTPQLAGLDDPLYSRFTWTGQELLIEEARSEQLYARGVISPQLEGNQFQGIRGFALDLEAERYPLALLPSPVPLNGLASFNGRLVGTPSSPQVDGTLLLEDFGVNQVAFDPVLLGPISYQPQTGLTANLTEQGLQAVSDGSADRIFVNFQSSRNFNFDVSWQGAQARGRTDGSVLRATLTDLPLQILDLPTINQRLGGTPQGLLSSQGEWIINLDRLALTDAGVIVENPEWGYFKAQAITAELTYDNQELTIADGKLMLNPFLTRREQNSNRFFSACPALTPSQPQQPDVPAPESPESAVPDTIVETVEQDTLSEYGFSAQVQLDTRAYEADVEVSRGNIEHVLSALAITEISDLVQLFQSTPAVETSLPASAIAGVPNIWATEAADVTLLDQLRRLSEICASREQIAEAESENPIPALGDLQGQFDAVVSLSGRPQQLPDVLFDVQGQDWRWSDDFQADRIIAQGQLMDGNLTLQPVRLETTLAPDLNGEVQQAFVNLAGNLSLTEKDSSGLQLVADQLPVDALRGIFNLPLGLDGRLNAQANFSGGIGNPTVRGNIILTDGIINNQSIAQADGLFLYENARLLLQGELTQVDNPEPLTLVGDIPYAFDFMTVQPEDDRIALTIDVADEGLALLNVLNNQVSWESGKGRVLINVEGRLSQPIVTGEMDVREAVLRSPLLPDPLTDFAGNIVFENNQINVKTLQGNYGNGRLQAAGSFPLGLPALISGSELAVLSVEPPEIGDASNAALEAGPLGPNNLNSSDDLGSNDTPPIHSSGALTVTLDDIDLELKGIYRGGVNGQVVVGGSLLFGGPQLGGVVELADGRLFLPEGNKNNAAAAPESEENPLFVPRFENLKITLAENIQIQQSNLLNVVAQGDLRLTGPLRPFRAIEPEGTIRLRSGRINLLTTTFRLAGRDNVARFIPERGIADPFLDLSLRTSVTETRQRNIVEATAFASSEITDSAIDQFQGGTGIETIRIRANYRGTASNLLESLFLSDISDTVIELSSSPARSRQEIINLLSGSYVAALQSGQGVINFFGGALLNRLQDFISSTLNLSEFRLFPVTGASRFSSEDNSGSSLDVATEIGFDITNNITLSLVKILTDNTPTEFNLRYRLTDEFTIRGTTNLDDRNRVLLEFETRF